jgi:hypothetical protein
MAGTTRRYARSRSIPPITYLQVRYGFPQHRTWSKRMRETFSPEVLQHLEVMRENGKVMFAGLRLVLHHAGTARRDRRDPRGCGAHDLQPAPLHAGGRRAADGRRCAAVEFKREADPKGLLNPGKMIAWDAPDFDYATMYATRA